MYDNHITMLYIFQFKEHCSNQ